LFAPISNPFKGASVLINGGCVALTKSYVVKSSINFANFGFFVRVGDILVHDTANGNKLTVYRGGEIVKAITQTALGMAALLKQGFVSELIPTQHPAVVPAPRAPETPKKASPALPKAVPASPKPAPKSEPSEFDKLKAQKDTILRKEKAKAAEPPDEEL
jgi:hypothetical protein